MPKKTIVIVLPEIDRVRWQAAADLSGVALERFVREAVEEQIERRSSPEFRHPR